jgi:acyl-coenzyme A synthetase/AMP-(fatty) acid ligase
VIGIYDKSQETELPRGYIVPASEVAAALKTDADKARFAKEIQAWIAARVAPHKRLSGGVVILPAIPKSPSGKILRKDLRVLAEKELASGAVAKL